MKTREELAAEAFKSGFNCAQSVVAAFCEKYGVDKETALKMSGGMGGGFRSGEICGAVSGAAVIVGLKYGQYIEGDLDAKKNCNMKTRELINAFKEKNSSVVCRDILKADTSPDGVQKHIKGESLNRAACVGMIKSAVEILEEQGY